MPVLGKDVPLDAVAGRFLVVRQFSPLSGSVVDGKVVASSLGPYGLACVDCPGVVSDATLLVTHKTDFLHLWDAWCVRGVADGEELLVASIRAERRGLAGLLSSVLPHLDVMIYPKGWLDRFTANGPSGDGEAAFMQPTARWEPGPPARKTGATERPAPYVYTPQNERVVQRTIEHLEERDRQADAASSATNTTNATTGPDADRGNHGNHGDGGGGG